MSATLPAHGADPAAPSAAARPEFASRPHPSLLRYYALTSLALGPFFWALLVPRYFRYHSLRYDFDDEGVTMRWGVLFRREISLTYARIQDIHLSSNVVERWLGLARIQVQTASGSASAEMTIEGLPEFERVRDFLYSRMRGVREPAAATAAHALPAGEAGASGGVGALDAPTAIALAAALRETAAELRALRAELRRPPPPGAGDGQERRGDA
jgi:membrane protein YdbS with pleckstrin-like domain